MGVSVSAKYLKDMAQDIIFGPGEKELKMFGLTAKLLLFCLAWLFSFVSAFSHFLLLNLFFGTQGKLRRLKFFYKHEAWHRKGLELSAPERPHRVLLGFIFVAQLLSYPILCDLKDPAVQASLTFTVSWSLLTFTSIQSAMLANHLILCCPILCLLSIFPSIKVFSNESILHIRWPMYLSFSYSISHSNDYSGLISFRIDWFDLFALKWTFKSLLQHNSKESILQHWLWNLRK